jgi:hypothetical protein
MGLKTARARPGGGGKLGEQALWAKPQSEVSRRGKRPGGGGKSRAEAIRGVEAPADRQTDMDGHISCSSLTLER